MQRDWTEVIKKFKRDCANNRSPADLVKKLHGDTSMFAHLLKYLTPNEAVGGEPWAMNHEML